MEPLLALVSQKRVNAGPTVGVGTRLKLVCNTWIGLLTAGTGQAFAMLRALGLDEKLFLEAIAGGQSDTPYAHAKGALMLADDYQPANFQLRGLHKDLELAEAATGDAGAFPILDAVRGLYDRAEDHGLGTEDIAAVFRVLADGVPDASPAAPTLTRGLSDVVTVGAPVEVVTAAGPVVW